MFARTRSINWIVAAVCVAVFTTTAWKVSVSQPQSLLAERGQSSAAQSLQLLESASDVFESVSRTVAPAVVYIEARSRDSKGNLRSEESGSGVLFRPQGFDRALVVTNNHVIGEAVPEEIDIHLAEGRLCRPVKVYRDQETDLAVLDPQLEYLPAAKLGDSDDVRIGQWVLVIGSPFGLAQSVTHGIVSATNRRRLGLPSDIRNQEFLQTDAPINPGNSGGPLVNLRGEVIGINTAIASNTGVASGVGFSIPVNIVRWVVGELLEHGHVRRGFLGIEFPGHFDFEKAEQLGLTVNRGALVSKVHADSPARQAGIEVDDVVLEFNGAPVQDEYHLINLVSQTPIGQAIDIVVWRDGRRKSLQATLSSWESFRARRFADK